ncbi:hypothetical protein BJ508DRAFT_334168 [Ascobolus immersus RN42]|uniref:Uncharacterized protein n=1 Tax=Ascobolus immersus RN42 TaxID=1160509 RepID=A0A3N4HH74_ASCIM|nr:hypothetical protein BJ508DRAFT_334168 [Ascobolus immersus RN42]
MPAKQLYTYTAGQCRARGGLQRTITYDTGDWCNSYTPNIDIQSSNNPISSTKKQQSLLPDIDIQSSNNPISSTKKQQRLLPDIGIQSSNNPISSTKKQQSLLPDIGIQSSNNPISSTKKQQSLLPDIDPIPLLTDPLRKIIYICGVKARVCK